MKLALYLGCRGITRLCRRGCHRGGSAPSCWRACQRPPSLWGGAPCTELLLDPRRCGIVVRSDRLRRGQRLHSSSRHSCGRLAVAAVTIAVWRWRRRPAAKAPLNLGRGRIVRCFGRSGIHQRRRRPLRGRRPGTAERLLNCRRSRVARDRPLGCAAGCRALHSSPLPLQIVPLDLGSCDVLHRSDGRGPHGRRCRACAQRWPLLPA